MRFRAVVFLVAGALAAQTAFADETQPEQKPGVVHRILNVFHPNGAESETADAPRIKGVVVEMEVLPLPLKLSETRQLEVVLTVTNKSRRAVHLEFPTTQRFEIIIRDQMGKSLVQWSDDQAFESEPGFVTINPREHVEYRASVATRDLAAGHGYIIDGFFPNYMGLKARKTILPQK